LVISEEEWLVNSSYTIPERWGHSRCDFPIPQQYVAPSNMMNQPIGLGTTISPSQLNDWRHSAITPQYAAKIYQMARLHYKASIESPTEYRIITILLYISGMLELPASTSWRAGYLYRAAVKNHRPHNHLTLLAACISTACREYGIPCPTHQLVKFFRDRGHRVSGKLMMKAALDAGLISVAASPAEYLSVILTKLQLFSRDRVAEKIAVSFDAWLAEIDRQARKITPYFCARCPAKTNPYITAVALVYAAEWKIKKEIKRERVLTQANLAACIGIDDYSLRDIFVKYCKTIFGRKQ
jgi:transcription initiation factor TFIIIB Brf1 subunit/transcription initiation factor TFIIB